MTNHFDDLAREVARGTSRRDVLRSLGGGLVGLLLSSVGIRSAKGQQGLAPVCGTCQGCELTTGTCGLPCNPPSAGTTLCTQAGSDGSYIRLAYYLTNNGFVSVGASDSVIVYQNGQLAGSSMTTNFTNGLTGLSASISYTVTPNGDILPYALVSQSGAIVYALGVDANGTVVQSIVTQQITPPSAESPRGAPAGAGQRVPGSATSIKPDLSWSSFCNFLLGQICDVGAGIYCPIYFAPECAGASAPTGEGAFPFCMAFVTLACAEVALVGCQEAHDLFCNSCTPNVPCKDPNYGGSCCPPCLICPSGVQCISNPDPNATCPTGAVCCNAVCCAPGLVCTNNKCMSPNPTCTGAYCGSFIDCNVGEDCQCYTIAEGGGVCAVNSYCDEIPTCETSADCGDGFVCAIGSCCGIPVCLPVCTPTNTRPAMPSEARGRGRRMSAHR
jgi:hypothetical protein